MVKSVLYERNFVSHSSRRENYPSFLPVLIIRQRDENALRVASLVRRHRVRDLHRARTRWRPMASGCRYIVSMRRRGELEHVDIERELDT